MGGRRPTSAATSRRGGPSYCVPGREGRRPAAPSLIRAGVEAAGRQAPSPERFGAAPRRTSFAAHLSVGVRRLLRTRGFQRVRRLPREGPRSAPSRPAPLAGPERDGGRGSCTDRVAGLPRVPPQIGDSVGLGFLGCKRRAQPRRTGRGTGRAQDAGPPLRALAQMPVSLPFPDRRGPAPAPAEVPVTATAPERPPAGLAGRERGSLSRGGNRNNETARWPVATPLLFRSAACGHRGGRAEGRHSPPWRGGRGFQGGKRPENLEETAGGWREPDLPPDSLPSFPDLF